MEPARATAAAEDEGYAKSLGNRQVQMIALGGAIGVGLFLGAGGTLSQSGPALVLVYAVCGIAAFFVMRALGELVTHRPVAASFVAYAREFVGPWAGFASGWLYWASWAMTGIAEITAVAIYLNRWLPEVPQWVTALVALAFLLVVNLVSVKLFGELEFWFAIIKVLAILIFLAVGAALVINGADMGGGMTAGVANLTGHGGLFPFGLGAVLLTMQSVIFAYSAIELVGITAGETASPATVLPRAINGVVWRISVFYVGSVLLLVMVLPWTAYSGAESPFVTVFSRLGVPIIGDVMNAVVLTAALSSCNSGLYSTGRILRSLAQQGEAPRFTARLSGTQVPVGGILFTGATFGIGVLLNYLVPQQAFDLAVAIASLGVISTWGTLLWCQLRLRRAALRGEVRRPLYRMPGAPYSGWITLAFLGFLLGFMAFSDGVERYAVYSIPVVALALWLGWRVVRRRARLT
ncbi:amino acid permease [Crossiella cryophila]|uniref:L-asparagine permease n=1 Tax=Crossiella cryophila TaxID=43355 RepID=A0A7W7FW99_9PSEU|nr:amino acid permease [Crossiella cryophila]MBB4679835.1 L-asparagine permease [Crossiella cryophila]